MKYLWIIFLIFACEKHDEETPGPQPEGIEALQVLHDNDLTHARNIRDPDNGWLEKGCDGYLWTGKYAAITCDVDMRASEFEETGRFGRTPAKRCWSSETGDNGSQTTWSRDMGTGLAEYAWRCRDSQLLQDHVDYGWSTTPDWIMGQPLNDGRVIYTPNMVGMIHQIRYAISGDDSVNRHWPASYPGGKTDYEAHLQVWSIKIRHEVDEEIGLVSFMGITNSMRDRILEHYDREPNCPFYSYMYHLFETGDMTEPMQLILDDVFDCEYLRDEMTVFIERIWVSDLILRRY